MAFSITKVLDFAYEVIQRLKVIVTLIHNFLVYHYLLGTYCATHIFLVCKLSL